VQVKNSGAICAVHFRKLRAPSHTERALNAAHRRSKCKGRTPKNFQRSLPVSIYACYGGCIDVDADGEEGFDDETEDAFPQVPVEIAKKAAKAESNGHANSPLKRPKKQPNGDALAVDKPEVEEVV
jgi:hypothetical protein